MKIETNEQLIEHLVMDLYSNEQQIIAALPDIIEKVQSSTLKSDLTAHLDETREQAARLKRMAEILECEFEGEKCVGMQGILKEGSSTLAETDSKSEVIDLVVASSCIKVEHYEIAGYRFLYLLLQDNYTGEILKLVEQSLAEEENAAKKLEAVM